MLRFTIRCRHAYAADAAAAAAAHGLMPSLISDVTFFAAAALTPFWRLYARYALQIYVVLPLR